MKKGNIDYINDSTENIAKKLLGKLLVHEIDGVKYSGYIVETEAYLGELDMACHSYKGNRTKKNEQMFHEGGTIYIYTVHNHKLLNFITGKNDIPEGVLIRAIEPKDGIKNMEKNRNTSGYNLTSGPGKLTAAMGIRQGLNGSKIGKKNLYIDESDFKEANNIEVSARIGINNKGKWTYEDLRYYVEGNPYVSKMKKSDFKDNNGWKKQKKNLL